MRRYSREMIAQVVSANDIVDVIGSCIELSPSGTGRFKALSPFTNEKTPSFMVSRDRQMFYCFSSSRGGDVIRFIMEFEGLSFNEALEKLAERAGIRLESAGREDNQADYQRRRILELNTFAARFYRRQLLNSATGGPGREYLKRRGLQESTEARFGLGLAVDSYDQFRDAALKQGFRENELATSGLLRKGDRSLYDFFRNRVIIPIKDISGNVVAFGGRDLGDSPAKYINSPETPAYKKSHILYGLYEARDALRKEGKAILVEGYFDLMRCFDAGIENVVATCGTALTEQQAVYIKRYVPSVVIVYDGDAAGIRAALKGISILTSVGLSVYAMAPPDGKDPDEYIRDEGAQAFRDKVAGAKDFINFYIEMNGDRTGSFEGNTEIAYALFAIIRSLKGSLRINQYLKCIADGLGIHEWECKRGFEEFCRNQRLPRRVETSTPDGGTPPPAKMLKDDIDFIASLITYAGLHAVLWNNEHEIHTESPAFTLAQKVVRHENGVLSLDDMASEEEQSLYTAAVNVDAPTADKARKIVEERVLRFMVDEWKDRLVLLQQQERRAQQDRDQAKSAELFDRILELKKRIESPELNRDESGL